MNLVNLISADISLKRNGKEYLGLCPFHEEKTPSFSVSPAKDLWYCFGCQKGGDAISWLREYRRLSYPEAAKLVGKPLMPDPWRQRRQQITAQLTQDYQAWKRTAWNDRLTAAKTLETNIQLYEAAYRALTRRPDLYPDADRTIRTLAALYAERDLLDQDLDVLQSSRHDTEAQAWWVAERSGAPPTAWPPPSFPSSPHLLQSSRGIDQPHVRFHG